MAAASGAPVKPAATVTSLAPSPLRLMLNDRLPAAVVGGVVEPPETSFAVTPIGVDCESRFAETVSFVVAFGGEVVVDKLMSEMVPVMFPRASA